MIGSAFHVALPIMQSGTREARDGEFAGIAPG
jgi:hypothetical protein